MKHEADRAGYAQTHCASLSNVHMRQRCVRPTVRAGVTDIAGPHRPRAAGMDATSVHACRACTRVVCMPEGCVSTRRAATQPRSAAASSLRHCAARADDRSSRRLTHQSHSAPTRDAPRRTRCHQDPSTGCPRHSPRDGIPDPRRDQSIFILQLEDRRV